eukprot:54837_1
MFYSRTWLESSHFFALKPFFKPAIFLLKPFSWQSHFLAEPFSWNAFCGLALDRDSCSNMNINANIGSLVVHCKHTDSCNSMNINLNIINEINYNPKIICYTDNACYRLKLTATSNILISMIMYNHSDEIVTNVVDLNNVNMICGHPNDRRYIQYKTDSKPKEAKLLRDARHKYSDGVLPCEDIKINVNREESITCENIYKMDQNLTEYFFTSQTVYVYRSIPECYWLNIYQLLNHKWTCNDTFMHDISLKIQLTVEDKHIDEICSEYFKNDTIANQTLINIDHIFYKQLKIMSLPLSIETQTTLIKTLEWYRTVILNHQPKKILLMLKIKIKIKNDAMLFNILFCFILALSQIIKKKKKK